ncbi:MAG: hypothetical protein IH851_12555 [Armatimonadetes bacterium]|nr:hypothetical protein [Armatimonadota bacterium]
MRKRKRVWKLVGCGVLLAALLIWLGPLVPLIPKWLEAGKKRNYEPGACLDNLKELSAGLMLYLESNDAYPPADRWMDEISLFLHAGDLSEEDQQKKLRCPDLEYAEDVYGYAFNSELSSVWAHEVEDPAETPVIYDSDNLERNASDPFTSLPEEPRAGGNNAIWADGSVRQVADKEGTP